MDETLFCEQPLHSKRVCWVLLLQTVTTTEAKYTRQEVAEDKR